MGGRGLSQASFGNGQNHNKDFLQRNRGASGGITCQQNGNGQKQTRDFFSFFCRLVVAIVLTLVTVALIQAKKLYQAYLRVCSDPGRRSTGPRIDMQYMYFEVA